MPELVPNRLATRLTAVGERHLRAGHPWLYDRAIERIKGEGRAGDLAIIFDRKRDGVIGIGLYDPHSPIRIKVIHRGGTRKIDGAFWTNEVANSRRSREALLNDPATDSYRLLNGENDNFPGLIADRYAGVLVLKVYSLIWQPYLPDVLAALLAAYPGVETVVLRLARRVATHPACPPDWEDGTILRGELPDPEVVFQEHGLKLRANVLAGHKTGFFLDHRHNRHRVGQLAEGAEVLDIFSYAGGFAVHSLAGGASAVTALDISEQALAVGRANVALNFGSTDRFQTLAGDAFELLPRLAKQRKNFDLVVCDPPSFAKRESEVAGALRAYERLVRATVPLVRPGGILLSASCSARVDADTFFQLQEDTLSALGRPFEVLEKTHHDQDHPATFPEGHYLKSIYFRLN